MAPAKGKAGNGELRQRKGKGPEQDEGEDDALLESGSQGWLDSFIILRAFVFMLTAAGSLVQYLKAKKDGDAEDAVDDAKAKKKDKGGETEKKPRDKEAIKQAAIEQLKKNAIPSFLLIVGVLTCLLIICGEGLQERDDRPQKVEEDYYGTLGVTRDAETAEIKRAYKTLARRWHPDKNPNCSTCQDTFSKIAVAAETLSDDKKRSQYDESGGIATAELKSPRSVPLTADNFDQLVTYSNDVWIVQVFKPDDSQSASFHPFWESQIQKYGHLVRFGRVDISSDLGKWLPIKIRVIPTVLKFARHLGAPQIFPITAMHETPQQLMKFVLTSFPNVGLPLAKEPSSMVNWVQSPGRRHKVLIVMPGKSDEERYKSHLMPRSIASRWSELFEFRTAETSTLLGLSDKNLPAEIRAVLPEQNKIEKQAAVIFFSADGEVKPKASALIDWPLSEDALVLQMLNFAEMAAPALTPRTAELLCRSPTVRRVYCLVLLDPPDTAVKRGMEELNDSRTQYAKEVQEIRDSGGSVTDEEDNFIVPVARLFRRSRGLQPSISTCRAPKFQQIEDALEGANAMLLDLDTGRIATLKGLTSFRGIYPQIAYEESLKWIDEALHPFLSLPDCDEGLLQYVGRTLRSAAILEILVQLVTALLFLEAVAKAATERSWKWALGAGALLMLIALRSPPFLRTASMYLPGRFFSPTLVTAS